MKDFISQEARERLIQANADASGDIGAVILRQQIQDSIGRGALRMVVDNSVQIIEPLPAEDRVVA